MTEYSMAKSAGELLCADMRRTIPGLRILVKRLPRILTDQTATTGDADSADPVEVILPLIYATHRKGDTDQPDDAVTDATTSSAV